MPLFYKIGETIISVDDYLDDFARYHLSFYACDAVDVPDIRIHIATDDLHIEYPKGTLVTEVNYRRWYTMPDGGVAFADNVPTVTDKVINSVIANKDFSEVFVRFCPMSLLNMPIEDRRPYHVIQEILRYALLLRDGTIIHSSSLAYKGKGLLFSAPSGTGKSTHTNLWLQYAPGAEIVNDDMPIVRFKDGVPMLYGAPWSGKNSIHKNMSVPLKALVFIKRGTVSSLEPMDKNEAVWQLLEAIRKPVIPFLAEKNLDIIARIVETLPVYCLTCDISEDAVKAAMQALE